MDDKPRRRWFQFSLRTIFFLVTMFSIWLGWQVSNVRERWAMRRWLEENGGKASPTMRLVDPAAEPFTLEQVNALPFWRRWLGDESISTVTFSVFPAPAEHIERAKRAFPEAKISFRVIKLPPANSEEREEWLRGFERTRINL